MRCGSCVPLVRGGTREGCMSYRVLARAYRSNTFDEVVGQDAIATTLKNAIRQGRVHHGYLFTGTRGVGKTSMARILAKALNCLSFDTPTPTPCRTCDSCRAIAQGEDVDVLEIDAASNTGVDNIRDLRGNAALRPARSRFRVYIIDEVHMLSTGAFNALLKTLEEPPSHVKFILATTESHKVPPTIQSRCQRFDFRAIETTAIAAHLRRLADSEKVKVDEAVLRRISRLANGSMRDALSLLDTLLSYQADELTSALLDELLPPPHDELAAAVIDRVAQQDAARALAALDRALQSGRSVERFCDNLIEHARTLMVIRVCGSDTDLVDVAEPMRPALAKQAEAFDGATYVYMITLLEELRRNVKFSGAARALADAAVVRLAMSRQFTDLKALMERLDGTSRSRGIAQPMAGARSSASAAPVPALTPSSEASYPGSRMDAAAEHPTARRMSSADRDRVLQDPLVQRVKEAVDGTVVDIRPAARTASSGKSGPEAEESTLFSDKAVS